VWREYAKIRMRNLVTEYNTIYKDAYRKNPSARTLERWFHKAVEALGYVSSNVVVDGNVWLKVWHDGNLDEDKIRELYAELKGSDKND